MKPRIDLPLSKALAYIAVTAVVTLDGCSGGNPVAGTHSAPPVPVSVIEAQLEQVPVTLETVGQAEGARELEIRARVGGILVKRAYKEGAAVKAGQALFEIDKTPYEIVLAQAKGQLAEQKARLEQSMREAARLKGLLNQRAISQKEFDDATTNSAIAAAGLQTVEAAVRQAELNLSYATVTAPVSGISGRAERSEGALITTGADSLLTTIVQVNPLWVRFGVADNELAALRGTERSRHAISRVEALLPDGSAYALNGRINFEGAQINRQLGTVAMRAEFDNPEAILMPGQFVRVRLIAGMRSVTLVPQTAVLQGDRGAFVYVAGSDGAAQPRLIKTDGWSGANWIVLNGLAPGDKVIVNNLLKLKPGAPVKLDESQATNPTAKPAAAKS